MKNLASDCILIVNDRCDSEYVRDSATRECVALDEAEKNCREMEICDGTSAEFDRNYGTCLCPINKIPEQIKGCCRIETGKVNQSTGQLEIDGIPVTGVYGLDDLDNSATSIFSLQMGNSGIFGLLPIEADTGTTRQKRQVISDFDSNELIQNPMICLNPGERIIFQLEIDDFQRNKSVYPVTLHSKKKIYKNKVYKENLFFR